MLLLNFSFLILKTADYTVNDPLVAKNITQNKQRFITQLKQMIF